MIPTTRVVGAVTEIEKDETIIKALFYAQEKLQKIQAEKQALEIAKEEAERKNAVLMHVNKNYTATEIAKELGMKSAQELNKLMEDKKMQYKINGTWVLASKYADKGYTDIKQVELENGRVVYDRKFTQLGREMLLNELKENN